MDKEDLNISHFTHLELLQHDIAVKIVYPVQRHFLVELDSLRNRKFQWIDSQVIGLKMPGKVWLGDHRGRELTKGSLVDNIEGRTLVNRCTL